MVPHMLITLELNDFYLLFLRHPQSSLLFEVATIFIENKQLVISKSHDFEELIREKI